VQTESVLHGNVASCRI